MSCNFLSQDKLMQLQVLNKRIVQDLKVICALLINPGLKVVGLQIIFILTINDMKFFMKDKMWFSLHFYWLAKADLSVDETKNKRLILKHYGGTCKEKVRVNKL